eukprot:jgi/Mesvir1/27626/Mv07358-RA.1
MKSRLTAPLVLISFLSVCNALTARNQRVWPVSNSASMDLPQSDAFGPKVYSGGSYDFHRGIDIPTPLGTFLVAIADGVVRIPTSGFSYPVVQVVHSRADWDAAELDSPFWTEPAGQWYYSTYSYVSQIMLPNGTAVTKGTVIAKSGSSSGIEHLQFDIRRTTSKISAFNPWRALPYNDSNTLLLSGLQLVPTASGFNISVNVTTAAYDLTFNRIALAFKDAMGQAVPADPAQVWHFDFEEANYITNDITLDGSNVQSGILIQPDLLSETSTSYRIRFTFIDRQLPASAATVHATGTTVTGFQHTVSTGASATPPAPAPPPPVPTSVRADRVWPLSNSATIDMPQSSPFGPRLKAAENFRYDWHRGIDIWTPFGTPMVAIADGIVRINGSHPDFADGVIQVMHTGWDESELDSSYWTEPTLKDGAFYATYLHISQSFVSLGQAVSKGEVIGLSGASVNEYDHLHFEIRRTYYSSDALNPWRALPYNGSDSLTVTTLDLTPAVGGTYNITVNVSVAPYDLTFNRIEIFLLDGQGANLTRNPTQKWHYDIEEANAAEPNEILLDNPFLDGILIAPGKFQNKSHTTVPQTRCSYVFTFVNRDVPLETVTILATGTSVFGYQHTLSRPVVADPPPPPPPSPPPPPPLSTRATRVWPVSGTATPDLPQSDVFGPKVSSTGVWDFHRGIDIPTPVGTNLVAIADGIVRIPSSGFSYPVVQVAHARADWAASEMDSPLWDEPAGAWYYATYAYVSQILVANGTAVAKGTVIAKSGSYSGVAHVQFDIRRTTTKTSVFNPWRALPSNGSNTLLVSALSLGAATPGGRNISVNISTASFDLTFNRIQLSFRDAQGGDVTPAPAAGQAWHFDFEEANYATDDVTLDGGNVQKGILIQVERFRTTSVRASYRFVFLNRAVPATAVSVVATGTTVTGYQQQVQVAVPAPAKRRRHLMGQGLASLVVEAGDEVAGKKKAVKRSRKVLM